MITDLLLALGLLLSPATLLRPQGSSIGPGEVCLVLGIGLASLQVLFGRAIRPNQALRAIVTFWSVFALALSLGMFGSYLSGEVNDFDLLKHDVKAYILAALFSALCVIPAEPEKRMRNMARVIVIGGAAFVLLQLAFAAELVKLSAASPWSWDRLRGLSENPNQLALMCVVQIVFCLHMAHASGHWWSRSIALICAVPPLVAGIMSKSDSFLVTLAVWVPLLAILTIRRWLTAEGSALGIRRGLSWSLVCVTPFLMILAIPVLQISTSKVEAIETFFYEQNREAIDMDASQRFKLWRQAFNLGMKSGMIGLGPGPHVLKEPSVSVAGNGQQANFRHFSEDPVANFEAHNTPVDLFAQGGLLAVLIFAWLIATTAWRAFRARQDFVLMLLTGISIFTMFHFMIRHPLFWFAIAFCLVASETHRKGKQPTQGAR